MNCKILYEDKDILVIYKPSGFAVQTKRMGEMDVESELKNYLAGKGAEPYVGIVHRLDQPVEGVMVTAANKAAAAKLGAQASAEPDEKISGKGMVKEYLAVVNVPADFILSEDEEEYDITLEDYLVKDGRNNTSKVVPKGTKESRYAKLEYRILEVSKESGCALALIRLYTGRHHQIRVQMAHAGFPLVCDSKYNPLYSPDTRNLRTRSRNRQGTTALCAYRLTFTHPAGGQKISFQCIPENPLFAEFDFVQKLSI